MKKLAQFDAEKDEWYYQPKIYINPMSADELYSETIEFRSSLSRDMSKKFLDNLDSMLEDESEPEKGKPKGRKNKNAGLGKLLNGNQKLRKPVISFFSDKAETIKTEIEKIERDMEMRSRIHREFQCQIKKDRREIEMWLQELSLYAPGIKHSIDHLKLSLRIELIGLSKEKRISKLSLWKDLSFLRRELRELTFELQALQRIAELVENGGKK